MEKSNIQRLFRQYYAKMYRVARAILYDEEESKDVISDIFVRLLRDDVMLLPETEENYLLTSVRNRCFKRLKHEEVKRKMAETYTIEQEEDEDERIVDIIEFVLNNLSSQNQRIFNLRFSQGYNYEEIAEIEHISKVAVWKHLSSIIKEIKEHFNQCSL